MPGVFIAFHFFAAPSLLHLFKKEKILGMTLHPYLLLVANSLFPSCQMHIFYVDLHTVFLVTSLHFGTQDMLVVEHKALRASSLNYLYI